jgi:hypothetical protein
MDNILDSNNEITIFPPGPKSPCFRNAFNGVDSQGSAGKSKFNFGNAEEDSSVPDSKRESEIKLDIAL